MTINWADLGVANPGHGKTERRVPCPMCDRGPNDTALGVNTSTGVFNCFRCGFKGKVGNAAAESAPIRIDDPKVQLRKRERLNAVWRSAVPLDSAAAKPVRTYLEMRGLAGALQTLSPRVMRAHPALEYFEGRDRVATYPAMVSMFSGAHGEPRTVHVTWIRHDGRGKAPVRCPRKLLPLPLKAKTTGGAIRLHADEAVMGIAEGIETALSLHLLHSIPVWSAFCARNLEQVRLPPYVRRIFIGVDVDSSGTGERSAEILAKRLRAWRRAPEVVLVRPTGSAPRDLNDDLVERITQPSRRQDGSNP